MLEHLEIRNFALIENLSIDFSGGFNVITGETGSGKSIILGALGLLMGEKADPSSVRTGADQIEVDAVVSVPEGHEIIPWLAERGAEPDEGVIYIRRTVRADGGRSLIHVQNRLFSRQDLEFLADSLIDMHGQSEHQSLLKPDRQRRILDSYAGDSELLSQCTASFRSIGNISREIEELSRRMEEGRRQSDYLSYALEEIENAKIVPGEDEELRDRIRVMGQFESIYENVTQCTERLREVRSAIYDANSSAKKAAKADSSLLQFTERLESTQIETEDIAAGLREYLDSVQFSEDAVNAMQERLALIQKLCRKYGPSLEDVQAFADNARRTLDDTENFEQRLSELQKAKERAEKAYKEAAEALRAKRMQSAHILQKKIEAVLRTLGMPDAVFSIAVSEGKPGISGSDRIEFMISANPGEPEKLLGEIASGGELSRVMLALKTVLAHSDDIQTQVFDEIDSGIGGSVAVSLAKCMNELSQSKQVIAITHLASIASSAATHFVVSKSVRDGRTYTRLHQVSGEDRVHEIARMLSGDEGELSLEHARRMLG